VDLEIPEDLQEDYGFPQITEEDKRKILGLNFARLMGVEVPAATRSMTGTPDRWPWRWSASSTPGSAAAADPRWRGHPVSVDDGTCRCASRRRASAAPCAR
jgi:hypothetical protein